MSMCISTEGTGKSSICSGCGKPVTDEKVDPKWYKKPHITVEFSLKEHIGGLGQPHNDHYNMTVHSIECLLKVDWAKLRAKILECELSLMHRENDDIGI